LVFSQFGNILEIVASRTYKLRGQAWIIFDDLSGATKALKEMQNFMFYGKPMRVAFAKMKSDVIAKMDGSFQPRPKRKPESQDHKNKNAQVSKKKKSTPSSDSKDEDKDKHSTSSSSSSSSSSTSSSSAAMAFLSTMSMSRNQQGSTQNQSGQSGSLQSEPAAPPNRILFVENLPADCTTVTLSTYFQQYSGFTECRLVNGKPGIAFVEFSDDYSATQAKNGLQSFKIGNQSMKISFAKK